MKTAEQNTAPKKRKWFKQLLNKYVIVSVLFVVWMLFFDQNSYLIHRDLDKQIKELKHDKRTFTEKLEKEKQKIDRMKKDSNEIERVARERHLLKKADEDIFIVEERKHKKQTDSISGQ